MLLQASSLCPMVIILLSWPILTLAHHCWPVPVQTRSGLTFNWVERFGRYISLFCQPHTRFSGDPFVLLGHRSVIIDDIKNKFLAAKFWSNSSGVSMLKDHKISQKHLINYDPQ